MIKHLMSLTEHSLEVSSKLGTLDRLDDSLSAVRMYDVEDISTESSSAFLRAVGIQGNINVDKEIILKHLEKIQMEVAKEVFMGSRNISNVIDGALRVIKDSYTRLNKDMAGEDRRTLEYSLIAFDAQTAQVNNKVTTFPQFLSQVRELNNIVSLVTDDLQSGILDLVTTNLEKPSKGLGIYILSNLENNKGYLNNATLTYKVDPIRGWRFQFNVKRRDVTGRHTWSIQYNDQVALRKYLKEMIEILEVANDKLNFSKILGEYRQDKKLNKGNLEVAYRFYIPMIVSYIRVIYLISDILREYLDND